MNLKNTISVLFLSGIITLGAVSCKSKVSDADIKTKIEAVVTNPNVSVDVKDGVVTVSGTATSEEEKTALETAIKAAESKGIKSVVNNVEVVAPVEINTNDADLQSKITDATKDFPSIKAIAKEGVITVTGELEQARIIVLKQALDALNPKRVDMSALTVK